MNDWMIDLEGGDLMALCTYVRRRRSLPRDGPISAVSDLTHSSIAFLYFLFPHYSVILLMMRGNLHMSLIRNKDANNRLNAFIVKTESCSTSILKPAPSLLPVVTITYRRCYSETDHKY